MIFSTPVTPTRERLTRVAGVRGLHVEPDMGVRCVTGAAIDTTRISIAGYTQARLRSWLLLYTDRQAKARRGRAADLGG
jgi:hypothetical protein